MRQEEVLSRLGQSGKQNTPQRHSTQRGWFTCPSCQSSIRAAGREAMNFPELLATLERKTPGTEMQMVGVRGPAVKARDVRGHVCVFGDIGGRRGRGGQP